AEEGRISIAVCERAFFLVACGREIRVGDAVRKRRGRCQTLSRKRSGKRHQESWRTAMSHHYSIVIQWSDEDQAYLVTLQEFGAEPQTHGNTYEEAVTNAQEVIDLLIETYQAEGWKLPEPVKHTSNVPA